MGDYELYVSASAFNRFCSMKIQACGENLLPSINRENTDLQKDDDP